MSIDELLQMMDDEGMVCSHLCVHGDELRQWVGGPTCAPAPASCCPTCTEIVMGSLDEEGDQ